MPAEPVFMPWVDRLPEVGEAAMVQRRQVLELIAQAAELERQAVVMIAHARRVQAGFLADVMHRWTVGEIQAAALDADTMDPQFLARAKVQDSILRHRLFALDGAHLACEALQAFQGGQVIRQHDLMSTASDEERRLTLGRVLAWWNHAARPVCERLGPTG